MCCMWLVLYLSSFLVNVIVLDNPKILSELEKNKLSRIAQEQLHKEELLHMYMYMYIHVCEVGGGTCALFCGVECEAVAV